jgi:hypothetical protein
VSIIRVVPDGAAHRITASGDLDPLGARNRGIRSVASILVYIDREALGMVAYGTASAKRSAAAVTPDSLDIETDPLETFHDAGERFHRYGVN